MPCYPRLSGVNATSYSYFGFSADHPFVFPSRELFRFGAGRAAPLHLLSSRGCARNYRPVPSGNLAFFATARRAAIFFSPTCCSFFSPAFCPRNCALTVFCRYFPLSCFFFPSLPFFFVAPRLVLRARELSLSLIDGREDGVLSPLNSSPNDRDATLSRPHLTPANAKRGKICIRTGWIASRRGDHLYHVPTIPLRSIMRTSVCVVTADVHRAA